MKSEIFEKAFIFTIGQEVGSDLTGGGFTNDPDDPGKKTKWGVSEKTFPHEDIENLTKDRAKQLAYLNYWVTSDCDKIVSLNRPLTAIATFDASYTCGAGTAKKFIQRHLGVDDDGIIGMNTVSKLLIQDDLTIVNGILNERKKYYDLIIKKNPKLNRFKNGWNNRIEILRKFLYDIKV